MKRNSPERDGDSIGRYIDRRRWLLTLAFFIFVILAMLLVFVITGISGGFGPVPFNLHSVLEADYGVDQFVFRVPPVLIDLIEEIIRDAGTPFAQGYVATVEGSLLTPVPTITPSGPQPTPTEPPYP